MLSEGRDIFLEGLRGFMEKHAMLAPDNTIVVGVSGGADSVALLHALHRLGRPCVVAHVNHCARGEDSERDEEFVRALCEKLRVPCVCAKRDIRAGAKEAGATFEEHARNERYGFFSEVAKQHGAHFIATAHHADDQAETVLMRILRGTGPEGLAGIPAVREWNGLRIVRPFLGITRAAIREWLDSMQCAWREDASNSDAKFRRNRVRHELLPLLESAYNPQIRDALLRLAEAQACDNAYWETAIEEAGIGAEGAIARESFCGMPEALQRRVLLRIAQKQEIELSHDRLLAAIAFISSAATGKYFDIGNSWQLYSGAEIILLTPPAQKTPHEDIALNVPGDTRALGKIFTATLVARDGIADVKKHCTPFLQLFDADALGETLAVRTRKDGDTFAPFGLGGNKKVQDVLVDNKIPAPLRDTIPLLFSGGVIAWVVGVAPSQKFAVTSSTTRVLEIGVRDATK